MKWKLNLLVSSLLWCFNSSQARVATSFDRFYPPYDEIVAYLESITSPVSRSVNLGNANNGKPLVAIKFSDNPNIRQDKLGFLFVGVIHGRERLGVQVVLTFIEDLLAGYGTDTEVTNWINAYEIWFLPVLNPFGYENDIRMNDFEAADGVDLNRNFDFRWDEQSADEESNPTRYRGPFAESEPETQAISNLVRDERPEFGFTFHCGVGGVEGLLYRPWGGSRRPEWERIVEIGDIFVDAVNDFRGFGMNLGSLGAIGQSSNYLHAATGMFDYTVEISEELWRDSFFTDVDVDSYNAAQQATLEDAEEYIDAMYAGIQGWLRHFLRDVTIDGAVYSGPGVTGLVKDCVTGAPLASVVNVIEIDDLDGDNDVDDTDRDYEPDGTPDWEFRSADTEFGRYLRLMRDGTWTLEYRMASYATAFEQADVIDPVGGVPLIDRDVALIPDGSTAHDCVFISAEADLEVTNSILPATIPPPIVQLGEVVVVTVISSVKNNGPSFPLLAEGMVSTSTTGGGVSVESPIDDTFSLSIPTLGVPLSESHDFTLTCIGGGEQGVAFQTQVEPVAAVDPNVGDNIASKTIEFACNQPPDCSQAVSSPDTLWPPNSKKVDISILDVTDPDGDTVTITVTSIFQDEVVDRGPTASGVGTSMASVRAQRKGKGNGRVYHVYFTADDGLGGFCDGEVTVCVPHDKGHRNSGCTDEGPLYLST